MKIEIQEEDIWKEIGVMRAVSKMNEISIAAHLLATPLFLFSYINCFIFHFSFPLYGFAFFC